MTIKCIAFDCFGTVFDLQGVSRAEIKAYSDHVNAEDFTPFNFPNAWWDLKLHADSGVAINRLLNDGFACVAMSNGSVDLIKHVSANGGVTWTHIVDLIAHGVYKPHTEAYYAIEKQTGYKPEETLMVTANPTFGDIEGAAAIGMQSQVIRHPGTPLTIIELAEKLEAQRKA